MNKLFKVSSLIVSAVLLGNIQTAFASSFECEEYIGCEKRFVKLNIKSLLLKVKGMIIKFMD